MAAEAEEEVRKNSCLSRSLHSRMKEYEAMSYHGIWCGVLSSDTSRFNRAMKSEICPNESVR
jgi:hypothetical protein